MPVSNHLLLILIMSLFLTACSTTRMAPLQTVEKVDLGRYTGLWYEIARIPHWFQDHCVASTATYTLRPDGDIQVINRCRDERDGALREATGRAWVVDNASNARLKVSFFWPFRGDYWIIDLGRDYDYAVIGAPNREYLWVLARTPQIPDQLYAGILARAAAQGFDTGRLLRKP